jgi:hypothetical protein
VTANQGLLSLRNLVILNQAAADSDGRPAVSSTVNLSGVPVTISILETPAPRFDADAPHRARKALVRVRAISCSFRDQSVIFEAALHFFKSNSKTININRREFEGINASITVLINDYLNCSLLSGVGERKQIVR